MKFFYPVILFALSCGIAGGQRLTDPLEPVLNFSDSWNPKQENARTSGDASASESGQERVSFQTTLGPKKIISDIYLPKLSGSSLVSLYRKYTGRRVIASAVAVKAEFSLVYKASPQDPITYAQAAEFIKSSAIIKGFTFILHPGEPNLDIFTPIGGIRPIRCGSTVLDENTSLPEGDEFISYVMTLKHLEPKKAVAIFARTVGDSDHPGTISEVPNTSKIIVTQRISIIRKLVTLKNEIDRP